ncbi:hypothetical protein BKA93DRAFT_826175 [Sparassis latifolia]
MEHDKHQQIPQTSLPLPGGKARGPNVNLSVCAGCKRWYYCSRECQKSDWPEHKEQCRAANYWYEIVTKRDDALLARERTSDKAPEALPSQVADRKLRTKWRRGRHFMPSLHVASTNAFRVGADLLPRGWEDNVFMVRIDCLPNPLPTSRPWSRFTVVDAKIVPFTWYASLMGSKHYEKFLKDRKDAVEAGKAAGYTGAIHIILNAVYHGNIPMSFSLPFDARTAAGVEQIDDWFDLLKTAVEVICGRKTLDTLPGSSSSNQLAEKQGDHIRR